MLGPIYPGFLKTGFYKYAKSNNLPVEPLKSFTDVELQRIDMPQLSFLPKSRKRIVEQNRDSPAKSRKEVQFVSNFSSYTTPIVNKGKLTLRNITNPYEIAQVSPVLSLGEGHG